MSSFSGEEVSSKWEEKRQKRQMEGLRRRVLMWGLSPESMREDLENIYMLLFRFFGNGFRGALQRELACDAGVSRSGARSDRLRVVAGAVRPRRAL